MPAEYIKRMRYRPPPRRTVEYGELLAGAAKLLWRHRFLLFFGLFAGTGTSLGGWNCDFPTGDLGGGDGGRDISGAVSDWVSGHLTLVVALAVAAALFLLALWLWSLLCKGALYASVRDSRAGEDISFRAAMGHGRRHFGRLLLFNLFLLLLVLGLLAIIVALFVLFAFLAASGGSLALAGDILRVALEWLLVGILVSSFGYLTCVSIFIVAPLVMVMVSYYAVRAVVLQELGPVDAIRRGVRLFVGNIPQTLLLFLISVGLSIGGGIGGLLVVFIAAVPGIIGWIVAYQMDFTTAWIVIASVLTLPLLMMTIAVAAVVNTFFGIYWTDAYLRLSGPPDGTGTDEADTPAETAEDASPA